DLLLRFINKTEKKNLKVVRSKAIKLIERESTNYIIPASHIIDKALDYITNNSTQKITIDSVARHLKISRRLLDMRFKQFHNKTVGETILEIRLNEVRKKLLTSSLPVKYIAKSYGFNNLQYLKKLFKKHFNEELVKPTTITLNKEKGTSI
ncbi:MAG: helix-turn-helix transcriptional regulator, partial [Kiritimatiellae bacterium]|nr:helix-turn-helix transcriptional regulator [Kiritimatiellia bacterium]